MTEPDHLMRAEIAEQGDCAVGDNLAGKWPAGGDVLVTAPTHRSSSWTRQVLPTGNSGGPDLAPDDRRGNLDHGY